METINPNSQVIKVGSINAVGLETPASDAKSAYADYEILQSAKADFASLAPISIVGGWRTDLTGNQGLEPLAINTPCILLNTSINISTCSSGRNTPKPLAVTLPGL
jgi:hypothetical protein